MTRIIGIGFCLLVGLADVALAQQPALGPEPRGESSLFSLVWVLFLVLTVFLVALLTFFLMGSLGGYKVLIDRSRVLAEEGVELNKQLLAAQQETNRLLARLVADRPGG